MFCFCFFRIFAPIFHFKLCSFFDGERKNISYPRAQGTRATPLFYGTVCLCFYALRYTKRCSLRFITVLEFMRMNFRRTV